MAVTKEGVDVLDLLLKNGADVNGGFPLLLKTERFSMRITSESATPSLLSASREIQCAKGYFVALGEWS